MSEKIFIGSGASRVVVFLVLLAIIGSGTYYLVGKYHQGLLPQVAKTESERIQQLNSFDKANLARKDTPPGDIFAALVRLAQQNDPDGLQEALARSKSNSTVIREGVAAALGYFEDKDSLPVLLTLLKDPERSVRVQAIYGLGRKQTPERGKALESILSSENLASDERIAIYSSLLQFSIAPETKNQFIHKITGEIVTTKDINQKLQGILILTQSGLRNPVINEMLKTVLLDENAQTIASVVIRNLAILKDPWFEKNLEHFLASKETAIRVATVQTLRFLCPDNRWSLLEKVLKSEADANVNHAALEELRSMPGPDANTLVEKLIKSESGHSKMNPSLLNGLKGLQASAGKNAGTDPCAFSKQVIKEQNTPQRATAPSSTHNGSVK